MVILHVNKVVKDFGAVSVLSNVTFELKDGDKVALVGANGCGKSTLMKILAGELAADSGSINWAYNGLSLGYVSQEDRFDPSSPLGKQLGPIPPPLLAECKINHHLLGRPAGTLSGGEKTRAALALALAKKPQVLLLDEPTDHLDQEGLEWLENVLSHYRGTVLMVSHDRYFLDKVTDRILEMEHGQVQSYSGNYTAYAEQKRAEQERAHLEYRQYVKEKKRLEESIRRQTQWAMAAHNMHKKLPRELKIKKYEYRSKAKAHMRTAKVMERRLKKIEKEKPREAATINLSLDNTGKVGRNLILAQNLGFTFDQQHWLFRHIDFFIQRGDRVALIGPNGSGKTTLLQLLLGQLEPTEGTVYRAPVNVSYMTQELEHLDPSNTVLEEATGGNRAPDQAYARTLLACLLFSGDTVYKKVAVLSGGEKVRLAIAKIILSAPDLLVLDEPTNGLDIPSRERVEDTLESYTGTLLVVSHDRYLLRRLANRVFSLHNGHLKVFSGGYEQFQQSHTSREKADIASQRLLLETRLAQLSAALADPLPDEKEQLTQEFIQISRELQALRG